jgi:glycosyltransferase involved in cell wall biosynthesis
MMREVVALSTRCLVTSEFAAELARIDVGPELADRIEVMPFAIFAPNGGDYHGDVDHDGAGAPLVCSFGLVHSIKRPLVVVDAFARVRRDVPAARLAFVGRCSDDDAAAIRGCAEALGVGDAVTITGGVTEAEYAGWHARATVAVQLRASSNGESSGAIGNALCFGVPTIVGALGAARELPDDAVLKVPVDIGAADLAVALTDLLHDDKRRAALRRGALTYAGAHSHQRVAAWLCEHLVAPS